MEQAEEQEIAQKIKDGEYFKDARGWYTALYISQVSERSAFLLFAVLAGLVFLIGTLSLMDLMPINERERLIMRNDRMDGTISSVHRLKKPGAPLNIALKKFFVTNYVFMRESYRFQDYPTHSAFVKEHSDPTTYAKYLADHGTENPRSYATLLGRVGERQVTITGVKIDTKTEPATAIVNFNTDFKKVKGGTQTAWTATLSFYYTKVSVNEVVDQATGNPKLEIVDPAFNVVSYSVVQGR